MTIMTNSTEFGLGGAWLAEYTLESLDAGIVLFDANARIVQWNPTAAYLFGIDDEQMAGRTLDDEVWSAIGLDGSPLAADGDPVRRVLADGEPARGEVLGILLHDESTAWISITALPVFGVDRSVRAVLASVVDITGLVRDRASLRAAELAGRYAFDHSMTAFCVVDAAGRVMDWNERFAELVGRAEYEIMASSFDLVCDFDIEDAWSALAGGGRVERAVRVMSSSGKLHSVVGGFTVVDWPEHGRVVLAEFVDSRTLQPTAPARRWSR